jgi:galactokinase
MTKFEAQLRAAGMSATESSAKAVLFEKLDRELRVLKNANPYPRCTFFVPGRLEFLGKHTDYAGGRSIVCAIERGICVMAGPRADAQIRIVDVGRNSSVDFNLAPDLQPTAGHWSNFPMTVAARLARDFPEARMGADVIFASDLPRASGMSSSSALIVAMFSVLVEVNSLRQTAVFCRAFPTREDLAGYLAAIESGSGFASFSSAQGVGTRGGSEDHVAILCSRAAHLRQYSYCPVRCENQIPFPEQHALVIAVSGVKADKTGDAREAYNRAAGAARKILQLWREAGNAPQNGENASSLGAILTNQSDALERLREVLRASHDPDYSPETLLNRLQQFNEESNEIVPAAADILRSGDLRGLGALVDRSQSLAETHLANQVPETIALARSARQLEAVAASSFGAGFGGSVWALVDASRAEEFRQSWAAQYHDRFPGRAEASRFFVSAPGPGLVQLA